MVTISQNIHITGDFYIVTLQWMQKTKIVLFSRLKLLNRISRDKVTISNKCKLMISRMELLMISNMTVLLSRNIRKRK